MGLFDFFKKQEAVEMAAQAISINVNNTAQFKRNVGRLVSLMQAFEQGDNREEVVKEMQVRQDACSLFGHAKPTSAQEARELFEKVSV